MTTTTHVQPDLPTVRVILYPGAPVLIVPITYGYSPEEPSTAVGKMIKKVGACVRGAILPLFPKSDRNGKTLTRGGLVFCIVLFSADYTGGYRVVTIAVIGLWILLGREIYIKATQGDV